VSLRLLTNAGSVVRSHHSHPYRPTLPSDPNNRTFLYDLALLATPFPLQKEEKEEPYGTPANLL
jgi:hypothetical protein